MYEACFSLHHRPFAATPDPACWFHDGPFQAVLDELLVCAEQGQGIGVLIAPAGAGKTLVCERLIRELQDRFATVFLRHATFATRRALLQTILCELDRPFDKATDQELRLGVNTVLKELHQAGRALVILVDEAHQSPESVLEELRILADHAHAGRPLVRLILAGQLGLEERLALPAAQALNQRIRAQVVLPPLTHAESADYIDFRLTWSGGRTAEIFSSEALDVVCRAADGVPRCLNHLCDHALLLAFVNGERPVSAATVRAALDDLSRLPLAWNAVPSPDRMPAIAAEPILPAEAPATCDAVDDCRSSIEFLTNEFAELPMYRLSSQWDAPRTTDEGQPVFADATPPDWTEAGIGATNLSADSPPAADGFQEELVTDRYAALDAGLEPPFDVPQAAEPAREPVPVAAILNQWSSLWSQPAATQKLSERLAAVQHVLDAVAEAEMIPFVAASLPEVEPDLQRAAPLAELCRGDAGTLEEQLGTAVLELRAETQQHLTRDLERPAHRESFPTATPQDSPENAVLEFGADFAATATTSEPARTAPAERSCRNLFTKLRRKQQGRE